MSGKTLGWALLFVCSVIGSDVFESGLWNRMGKCFGHSVDGPLFSELTFRLWP